MPRGGFGNLIALPLQHEPRQLGNSVFIDEQFKPFPDQWAFLASVSRVDPALAAKIAQEAIRTDQVIGVRSTELTDDQEDSKPWTIPPSKRDREIPITGPLPPTVRAVLSQRLYIEKQGLPAALLNRLKRLAALSSWRTNVSSALHWISHSTATSLPSRAKRRVPYCRTTRASLSDPPALARPYLAPT